MSLRSFLALDGNITEINSDTFYYEIVLSKKNISEIQKFFDGGFIEQLKDFEFKIISIDDIDSYLGHKIHIEFLTSQIKNIGYYLTFNDFLIDHRFVIPSDYYIHEINFLSSSYDNNEEIEKYKSITTLIDKLISKAKFVSDEHIKTVCLVQENLFIEISIDNVNYEEYLNPENIERINQYIENIDSYQEKRTIFLKEMIDFLIPKTKSERFCYLILNFEEFYENCNSSFEYYLSNFSYNKIKIEIDNSVLEYSKNIRSIINDSQSKLIAIPAAFILGASQIVYDEPFVYKNFIIIASSFLFSYIISIFINNQKNAIEIISDNLDNYKINYQRSKSTQLEEERELKSLSKLINDSYLKVVNEIKTQKIRLTTFQYCNWGVSILLLISLILVIINKIECNSGT